MIKNYLKMAIKNLLKHKLFSFITTLGLAIGMACFFLISGYIQYEKSYDDFHLNGSNIYRVDKIMEVNGRQYLRAFTGAPLASLLLQDFPIIKNTARFLNLFSYSVDIDGNIYKGKRFFFGDNSVLEMFTFPLKIGDPKKALKEPFTVIITSEIAERYFNKKNPIGQIISFQSNDIPKEHLFKITGVVENIPSNSSVKFDFLASFSSLSAMGINSINQNWDGPVWTYIQLQNGYNPEDLKTLFPKFIKKYIPGDTYQPKSFELIPLKNSYYTRSEGVWGGDWGIKPISYLLLLFSALVLMIACVNFANLLSARSITRAKEIGIRKVHGANRFQLINQFLFESCFISLISYIFAIILAELLLPSFQTLLSNAYPTFNIFPVRKIDFSIIKPIFLLSMFLVAILVGMLSGLYPAIILSKYNVAYVIKGEMRKGKSSALFRKILVITQFAIAIILINCSISILRQIGYWNNYNPGYEKKDIVCIPINSQSIRSNYEQFKNRLLKKTNIFSVTGSSVLPGGEGSNILTLRAEGKKDINVVTYYIDYDFIKTLGLKISGGRDFSNEFADDSQSNFLINRNGMNINDWKDVTGQEIKLYLTKGTNSDLLYKGNLIGIVNNFDYRALSQSNEPLILKIDHQKINYILIRIKGTNFKEALNDIKITWGELNNNKSFDFTILSDIVNSNYALFHSMDSAIRFTALIAILIACLGLMALASFIIERKTKEIGIRKVLGASGINIIAELTKSFIFLVIIANIIAFPLSYIVVGNILQGLPHHLEISVWLLLSTIIMTITISGTIIIINSLKFSKKNPIDSLRIE